MMKNFVALLLLVFPCLVWGQGSTNYPASIDSKTCSNSEEFYPRESRLLNQQGTVVLRFNVEADGRLAQVEVERSSGFERLDLAAKLLLYSCKFKPGMVNGKLEKTSATLEVIWKLDGTESNPVGESRLVSTLPPCLEKGVKHNCFGTYHYSTGIEFSGEFRDGMANGEGIEYRADGSVSRSGRWMGANLVSSYAIDPSRFPIRSQMQSALPPKADLGKTERDRLAAEVEAERKKRQDLEQRLAEAEAKERERQQAPQPQRPQVALRNERRLALVIGNSNYKVSPLDNPANDANDVAESLKKFGFQTTLVRNATLGQMREATRKFADQLPSADVALIYFAGHGIESNRKNYMIPVNADLKFEYELADQGYDAGIWLEMLESIKSNNADRVNIVILDACRNNSLIGSRNLGSGLGKMDAPSGTFLAYSTAPGKVAADGGRGERNSPFTKHLIRAMQQPNQPIEEVFKEVRRNVGKETNGAQVPWESTSLTGFFTFRQGR